MVFLYYQQLAECLLGVFFIWGDFEGSLFIPIPYLAMNVHTRSLHIDVVIYIYVESESVLDFNLLMLT